VRLPKLLGGAPILAWKKIGAPVDHEDLVIETDGMARLSLEICMCFTPPSPLTNSGVHTRRPPKWNAQIPLVEPIRA
jgi:hypothetical protein